MKKCEFFEKCVQKVERKFMAVGNFVEYTSAMSKTRNFFYGPLASRYLFLNTPRKCLVLATYPLDG
eukprot:TRINITY_DN12457_c0_g1_i1.p1 TRINITY_DN12457_c0_g1~~TRINITY_DN12457_c0_g1_i1.p1  ORF type:complete len:66 (-),score=3.74 TRINITY_DN12457_c0_g1_i1:88-285(-)